jgi:hypothetical protein
MKNGILVVDCGGFSFVMKRYDDRYKVIPPKSLSYYVLADADADIGIEVGNRDQEEEEDGIYTPDTYTKSLL